MTLNEAIRQALSTQYKKDAPEAFRMVEEAGYKVSKWDGKWHIENPATWKRISLAYKETWDSKKRTYVDYVRITCCYSSKDTKDCFHIEKFDFVNCLNKPRNVWAINEQHRLDWYTPEKSKAIVAWEAIKSAKHDIEWHTRGLKEEQEKFNKELKKLTEHFQWEMDYHSSYLASAQQRLAEKRAEFGLTSKK